MSPGYGSYPVAGDELQFQLVVKIEDKTFYPINCVVFAVASLDRPRDRETGKTFFTSRTCDVPVKLAALIYACVQKIFAVESNVQSGHL